jgi:hypothetical protein
MGAGDDPALCSLPEYYTNRVISKSFTTKKAMRVDFAKQFTKDCHQLGIVSHAISSWPS